MTKQWGGRRPGSGSPRKRLNISVVDENAPRDLATLTKRWRKDRNQPDLTEESVVMELVRLALANKEGEGHAN